MATQKPCEHCGRPPQVETRVEIRVASDPATIGREVVRTLRALSRGQGPGTR